MRTVALTGSLAAGKSTVAAMFAELGIPVFDADAVVDGLYAPGGAAVEPLLRLVPAAAAPHGGLDRGRLSAEVVANPDLLREIERIVHPLVDEERKRFLERARRMGAPYAVLEEPLLFETGRAGCCDMVVTVHAPRELRKERALRRSGMTEEKFSMLDARQIPEAEKRAAADFVIDASGDLEDVRGQVRELHRKLLAAPDGV